mmetsp:Transcript_35161/g.87306  ORF Transcript_35161/g.87306 Transcript_35161/m.87306 type:complete len:229 (+) Transcript_35161:880-1566(+)
MLCTEVCKSVSCGAHIRQSVIGRSHPLHSLSLTSPHPPVPSQSLWCSLSSPWPLLFSLAHTFYIPELVRDFVTESQKNGQQHGTASSRTDRQADRQAGSEHFGIHSPDSHTDAHHSTQLSVRLCGSIHPSVSHAHRATTRRTLRDDKTHASSRSPHPLPSMEKEKIQCRNKHTARRHTREKHGPSGHQGTFITPQLNFSCSITPCLGVACVWRVWAGRGRQQASCGSA